MPLVDGHSATQLIREIDKDIPIITQTAYALEGDKNKALEAVCNDYIAKPIKKNELLELLRKHLESKKS